MSAIGSKIRAVPVRSPTITAMISVMPCLPVPEIVSTMLISALLAIAQLIEIPKRSDGRRPLSSLFSPKRRRHAVTARNGPTPDVSGNPIMRRPKSSPDGKVTAAPIIKPIMPRHPKSRIAMMRRAVGRNIQCTKLLELNPSKSQELPMNRPIQASAMPVIGRNVRKMESMAAFKDWVHRCRGWLVQGLTDEYIRQWTLWA